MEAVVYICTALAALESVLFAGFRIGFVFIDHAIRPFFSRLLWAVCILNTVGLFALSNRYLAGKDGGLFAVSVAAVVLTGFYFIICCIFLIRGGKRELPEFALTAAPLIPFFAVCWGVLYFGLINPLLPKVIQTAAFAAAALILLSVLCLRLLPFVPMRFSSPPAVFDFGAYYSVAFASNVRTTGYVRVGEKTYHDSFAGRKRCSRLHAVKIPKTDFGDGYTVGLNRAVEALAYGGIHGKKPLERTIDGFSASPETPDKLRLCVFTDWHWLNRQAARCAEDDYDVFVFLGDFSQGVYSEGMVIRMLLGTVAGFTKGQKPCVFARGNHDFRGPAFEWVSKLARTEYLSFRTAYGNYEFFVADSGEDKPDDNYEYAGYNDFDRFRAAQVDWLQDLVPDETKRTVLLSHSRDLVESGDWPKRAYDAIAGKAFYLHLYGHNHSCRVGRYANEKLQIPEQPFPCVCCGGVSGKVFTYALVCLEGKNISLEWKEANGKTVKTAEIIGGEIRVEEHTFP